MGVAQEPVTGTVLAWAIDESGYALDDVASRLKVDKSIVQDWMEETDRPTVGQLTQLARYLKRPRLLFFLPHPPAASTTSHFRQAATQMGADPLTPAERLMLRQARRIQDIVSSLVRLDAPESVSIPQATTQDDPVAVGYALRRWVAPYHTSEHRNFAQWRAELRQRRILVLTLPVRQGTGTTSSSLRGFALSDPYAPAIAISTADNLAARSFTLFHELAHLATDTGQSCGPAVAPYQVTQDAPSLAALRERWCDAVAGSALIPPDELDAWVQCRDCDDLGLVRQVAAHFKISFRAAAVFLIQAGTIPASVYGEVERTWPLLDRTRDNQQGGGRTRAQIRVDEWGGDAIGTILAAYDRRRISEITLRRWLDIAGPEIDEARALVHQAIQ